MELLLEYGANPNDRWKSNKETALHTALKGSYPYQKAKLLLKYGADITATDQDQLSVMHYIFKNEVGNTSLDIESNMLRLLHKSKNQLSYLRKKGTTLYASESEILRTVILLLKKGADPVAKDSSGNSPLHIAAKGGYGKKIIDKLIEIGNNPDEKNLFGETPAILAAKNFKKQTFKILASSDEEKDIASIVCLSNVDVVKECIDKANTLNIKDHENCTLLHYAVLRKSTSIIKALVSKGVEINSSNKYFETALDLAKIHLKNNIIKYLENKGAKTYQDLISSNQIKRWISQLDRIIANSHLDTNK